MTESTKIEYDCTDECYCGWYKCLSCGDDMITDQSNFCPNCGRKIEKLEALQSKTLDEETKI